MGSLLRILYRGDPQNYHAHILVTCIELLEVVLKP